MIGLRENFQKDKQSMILMVGNSEINWHEIFTHYRFIRSINEC
jgi:hypothetical protein